MEIDEKRRLEVLDRSGSTLRSFNLGNQGNLDVLLSNDHHHKALLLKVPKEYDLVSSWKQEGIIFTRVCIWKSSWNLIKVKDNRFQNGAASCLSMYSWTCVHFEIDYSLGTFSFLSYVLVAYTLHPNVNVSMILQMYLIYITSDLTPIMFIFPLWPPLVHPGAVFWWREQTYSICQASVPGSDRQRAGD